MSIFYAIKNNYTKIPNWMLTTMGAAYYTIPSDLRYGKVFRDTIDELRRTEYCTTEKKDEIVNSRFLSVVHHAYEHVPFYKELYDEFGVNMPQVQSVEDIKLLPVIDKEILRRNTDNMIADNADKSQLMYITTSGTTGSPVGFYQCKSIMMIEWAYTMHIWSRVGCKPDSSRLILRGKAIRQSANDPDLFWDPLRRELSCNVFDMTEDNMEKYCRAIEQYRPEFIHGYMSATIMLCKYISNRNGGLRHQFKAILATSESIVPEQRAYVEHILNARVFSFYGHSERLVIAGECEKANTYHIEPLYGYAELLNESNNHREPGELIATGFLNFAMPLIRYRTGDIASWDNSEKCACERCHLRLETVHGRSHQDVLVNSDGVYVSMTALNIHTDDFDKIFRYQFVQEEPGIVDMLIMPLPSFTVENEARIKALLTEKCFEKIQFNVATVANIPLLKNGKFRIVEQKIPIDF